jgi:hypothetical protein
MTPRYLREHNRFYPDRPRLCVCARCERRRATINLMSRTRNDSRLPGEVLHYPYRDELFNALESGY